MTASGTTYPIDDSWFDTDLTIVQKGDGITSADSLAQTLTIPARPTAPTGITAVAETRQGKNDGMLTDVDDTMEYRAGNTGPWTAVPAGTTQIAGLAPGTYQVRLLGTGSAFASAAADVTIAAGAVPPSPPRDTYGPYSPYDRTYRTLTDPYTGVSVYGNFNQGAWLWVGSSAHAAGTCYACDQIRAYQAAGQGIALHDIAVQGGYQGDVRVSIPVGSRWDGQQVRILHCAGGLLETRTVTVSGGTAQGMFSGLSPFAVVQASAVSGLPGSYILFTGGRVSWMPLTPGGVWSYDTNSLFLTQQGDWYTFHALRAGYTAATYTVNGVSHTVQISIGQAMLPQTGQSASPLPGLLLALAVLCAAGAMRRKVRG